jgi:hypothetical protein
MTHEFKVPARVCAGAGIRTPDPRLKRPLLCQAELHRRVEDGLTVRPAHNDLPYRQAPGRDRVGAVPETAAQAGAGSRDPSAQGSPMVV